MACSANHTRLCIVGFLLDVCTSSVPEPKSRRRPSVSITSCNLWTETSTFRLTDSSEGCQVSHPVVHLLSFRAELALLWMQVKSLGTQSTTTSHRQPTSWRKKDDCYVVCTNRKQHKALCSLSGIRGLCSHGVTGHCLTPESKDL
jgi:hypothetical protein